MEMDRTGPVRFALTYPFKLATLGAEPPFRNSQSNERSWECDLSE